MKTIQSAVKAWNAKDWDTLARIAIPLLPPLPNDGNPVTATHERTTFAGIIPSLQMPKPLEAAAYKYLNGASDIQVRIVASHVRQLAGMLDKSYPAVNA